MTLSTSGLIGGLVGFVVPTALYLAVAFAFKQRAALVSQSGRSEEERERSASMIRLVLLADIPILTAIGYYVGQTYG
jgi:hypothetical protein